MVFTGQTHAIAKQAGRTVCALAAAVMLIAACVQIAWADDAPLIAQGRATNMLAGTTQPAIVDEVDYSTFTLEELKEEVEAKTAERDDLQAQSDELASQIDSLNARIEELDGLIAVKQRQADATVRERYKIQRQGATLVDALLRAPDFQTLLAGIEYIEAASAVTMNELTGLRDERATCESELNRLERERAGVDERLERVSAQLEEATSARDEAQRKADMVANAHLVPDGADWDAGEEAFIGTWAPRIDAYLDGSPLAGQGATFARAAWTYHIDPRWSAAISNIESSKGRFCIRPHNAWGWGAADSNPYGLASEWGSWEEAIFAHARGLANGYGYTISVVGAQTYCPPNWELWYATTVSQMNGI